VRDTVGLVLDVQADPVANHRPKRTRDLALVLRAVNDRANLLPADKVVDEAALDKYSYMRDAYLQRRRNLIHDGNPPREVEASAETTDRALMADVAEPEQRTDAAPAPSVLAVRTDSAESGK
jgi:ABC-type transporter lipoprotein component MlaA